MRDAVQGNPSHPHDGVPDEAFVPHLNDETEVQPVDLAEGEGERGGGGIYVSNNVKLPYIKKPSRINCVGNASR